MTGARQRFVDFGRWLRTGRYVRLRLLGDVRLEVQLNPVTIRRTVI